MSRKKKSRNQHQMRLNMAPMLDMAFQLLTFFILTFRPAPVEGQVSLRMPPPIPITEQKGSDIGKDESNDPLKGLERIIVTVGSNKQGEVTFVRIGEIMLPNQPDLPKKLAQLNLKLAEQFKGATSEMVLMVGSGLRYEQLMQVVEICSQQKLANGDRLSKLTFTEFPDGSFQMDEKAKK